MSRILVRLLPIMIWAVIHVATWIAIWGIGALDAYAQNAGKSAAGKNQNKRTTINFEDQLVEGQAQKPELFYLLQQRNNNFKRLIRLRENFLPEMRKSSEDIGRPPGSKGGGG